MTKVPTNPPSYENAQQREALSPQTHVQLQQPSYRKWLIWSLAALFYLYETFLRVSPSVMTQQLMEDFGVTSTKLGVLTSFYYYAYVPLQIPCGMIVDRLGIRFILSLSCLLCVVGTLMFAGSDQLWVAQIGRFILGAGSACAFISCLKITAQWFNPIHFALVAGLTNMMGTLGGLCAGKPLAMLVNYMGWRRASVYLGLLGLPVMLLIWFYFKKRDHTSASPKTHNAPQNQHNFVKTLPHITQNSSIWIAGIVGGLMYLPISAFAELWGVPFFMATHSIDNEVASSISHMVFIGMALGSPTAAWLLSQLGSIKKVMQLSALLAGLLFVCIAFAGYFPIALSYVFVFAAGFCLGGQVLCFTIAKNHTSEELSGTAIGFTNALVMMSGIIFQPLLGHILDVFWDGTFTLSGIRNYTAYAYKMSMLTIPACFILSVALLHWIKNQPQKNNNEVGVC